MAEGRCCSAELRDRWAQAEKKGEESQILRGGQSVDMSEEGPTEHLVRGRNTEAGGQRPWGSNSPFFFSLFYYGILDMVS